MSAHHGHGPKTFSPEPPVKVLVTGAAGQIAYSLVFLITRGAMFGPDRRVILHLLDIAPMQEKLDAMVMEIEDTAPELVAGVVATSDYAAAFADIDVALLVGARPRGPGMERKDLLAANAAIFKGQGDALEKYAKKSVKVLVVGNPANTNALITLLHAPSIPKANFTALTRLDMNRARSALAKRIGGGANPADVRNVIIWGNHSTTQFPDTRFGVLEGHPRAQDSAAVPALIADKAWLQGEFVTAIQQRGKAVIDKRGASSAASAASAIVDHIRDWVSGSSGDMVSMGVYVDPAVHPEGLYGGLAPAGTVYSLPVVTRPGGEYTIVADLSLDDYAKGMLKATADELLHEKELALAQ